MNTENVVEWMDGMSDDDDDKKTNEHETRSPFFAHREKRTLET